MKTKAHIEFFFHTDLWALKNVLLLEWPVCYFYWSHKLLTVSVMTGQVSLILSSLFTNCISLLTDRSIRSSPNLLNSGLFYRKSFTTALKVQNCRNIQSSGTGYDFTEQFKYEQRFIMTDYQNKCIFLSKPSEQKLDQNRIGCGNKTNSTPKPPKPAAAYKIIPGETLC